MNARRRWWLVAGATIAAVTLAGCGGPGSPPRTATAVFNDVGDLSSGAQVQLADVPVGSVSSISLDGGKAKVTLALAQGVRIPADVTAALDRTTILGDQFVNLEVPKSEVGAAGNNVPQLANGAVIRHTAIVPDVEQLVGAGAQVFGAVSTTQLEQIIAAGGQGFAGQEASLKTLLNDFSNVAAGYAQHTSDITSAVNGLHQLTSTLAPSSGATADALTTLSKTVGHPGPAVIAVRDAVAVDRQPLGPGPRHPRDLLPADLDPAPGPAGGQLPAQPESGSPRRHSR